MTRVRPAPVALLVVGALSAALAGACTDPIHDGAVAQQGPDTRAPGTEFHRAGQQCVVCHDGSGPASAVFTVAGTVFAEPGTLVGANGVDIEMTDAVGSQFHAQTNCVGNFFVRDSDWAPHFPILVRISKMGSVTQTMVSTIGREGSCGHCHVLHVDDPFSQMNHVYLGADDPMPPNTCGANPDLGAP
jgi:hypothetical protein